MQLKRPGADVRRRLIAASCTLLSATAACAEGQADPPTTDAGPQSTLDSTLAYYHESQGRVSAIEPIVSLRADFGDERVLNLKATFDSLSGSTPNGAVPGGKVQTFASPSGTSLNAAPQTYTTASGQSTTISAAVYSIAPGQLPMDPNYKDQRLAFTGSYQHPLSRLTRLTYGSDFSYEHDFLSASLNASLAHDFNERNTTVSLGANGEFDQVRPIGGAPVAGTDYTRFEKRGAQSRNDANLVLGITQLLSRRWLSNLSVSYDRASGYLNDPYKIVSIVDTAGNVAGYLYEKRPDQRSRQSAFLENRLALDRGMVAASFRYMSDDWGIHSDTVQLRMRWQNPERDRYVEPQLRWYRQSAANFYTPWLDNGGVTQVAAASADERLGAFHAVTWGLKYAAQFKGDAADDKSELSIRAELYRQTPDHKIVGPGALAGFNLYPGLQAVMLSVQWDFGY